MAIQFTYATPPWSPLLVGDGRPNRRTQPTPGGVLKFLTAFTIAATALVLTTGTSIFADNAKTSPVNSIVMIRVGDGHGTGVIVDAERGHILTNAHVIGDRKVLTIRFRDGQEYSARVLRRAKTKLDLILLKIEPRSTLTAARVSCRIAAISERVIAIGHPGPFRWAITKGLVAAQYAGSKLLGNALVLDLTIWHGNSGGGLFDENNRLVGITTAMFGRAGWRTRVYSGFSFAISGPDLCAFLRRGRRHRHV